MTHEHSHEHSCNGHHQDLEENCGRGDDPASTPPTQKSVILGKFRTATILCTVFLIVEVIGGYLSSSLAIYSDAAHLVSDLASIGVAMGAAYLADLPQTQYYTYGLKRVESLAALLSMVSLAAISLYLFAAAIVRLWMPEPVDGKIMSGVAAIGVLVNIALAAVLGEHHVHMPGDCSHDHGHTHDTTAKDHHTVEEPCTHHDGHEHSHEHKAQQDHSHGHSHETTSLLPKTTTAKKSWDISDFIPFLPENINLRATYLHVLGDLLQSVAVLIAGLLLWQFPKQTWIDAVVTLLFCAIVFASTVQTLKASLAVLLQQVPSSIEYVELMEQLSALPNIYNVHDLHIWSIAHGVPSLSVHCHTTDDSPMEALKHINDVCRKAGIFHITAQVQTATGGTCVTCDENMCRIEHSG